MYFNMVAPPALIHLYMQKGKSSPSGLALYLHGIVGFLLQLIFSHVDTQLLHAAMASVTQQHGLRFVIE
jgi:hypothetical protein